MNTGINSSSNAAGSGIGGIATVAQRIRDRAHQLESTRFELSQLQRTVTRQGRIIQRAGAFVGRKMPFSELERKKSSQHPSRNPAIAIDRNEYKAKAAKEVETNAVMIATHHGCEVF